MARITKKTIENIFNDFKDSLFIADALLKNKINHYDFFEYINSNVELLLEYEKIQNYNNIILEERVAQLAYSGQFDNKILLEMLKANNKKKYNIKQEIEINTNHKSLSDEELEFKIAEIQKRL